MSLVGGVKLTIVDNNHVRRETLRYHAVCSGGNQEPKPVIYCVAYVITSGHNT